VKERSKIRPIDSILEFDQMGSSRLARRNNEIQINQVIKFESLPISGWQDGMDDLDRKCKQSCVKDCSCVYHCTWVIA
jgi:hypothetical protein